MANVVYQIFVGAWGDLPSIAARVDHIAAELDADRCAALRALTPR